MSAPISGFAGGDTIDLEGVGTAATSEITGLPATVVLPAGQTSVSVPFAIAQNPLVSVDPETFSITAMAPDGSATVSGAIKAFVSTPFAFTVTVPMVEDRAAFARDLAELGLTIKEIAAPNGADLARTLF